MKNLQVTFENLNTPNLPITLHLSGRLNEMNAFDFKNDLLKIVEVQKSDCVLDISKLSSMDIIGMNALAIAHKRLDEKGSKLTIINKANSQIDRVLHLTKFDRVLNLTRA